MRGGGKSTTIAMWIAVVLACLGAGSCASDTAREDFLFEDEQAMTSASPYGKEEVLDDDDEDEFGVTGESPGGVVGEFFVAVGYVGLIVAGIVLPLLAL